MRESWRWFGPNDPVSLDDIRQTGATDIVTALHHIPTGEVWTQQQIETRQQQIETTRPGQSPLKWSVVESIPVHEDIKLGKPGCGQYIDNWIESLKNLAVCGINTICYNFMPVIDWTRTELRYQLPSGAYALRFDFIDFAAFDLFILQREGAERDYSDSEQQQAQTAFAAMSDENKERITRNIIAGLPGRMTDSYGLDDFRKALDQYRDIDHDRLRQNLVAFLQPVLAAAEQLGVNLAIHPDDPPWAMFGLPRIICTLDDLDKLFARLPSPANGITLCVGTYGSRADNDLPQMARQYGERIHFAHLRGVSRDPDQPRSFYEANHLDSDVDMVQVIKELLKTDRLRPDNSKIYIRPDHGHQMMDDIGKTVNPGYSGIGRLRGLSEIRGVIHALEATH